MVLGCRDGRKAEIRPFGYAGQIVLLLLGAAPQLAAEGHPRRVKRHIGAVAELDHGYAVVEVVGRYGLDARSGHRHGWVGLEACHAEHRDQQRRLVLADAAAVGEVGAGVVQGVTLALAHRDARITHVVGNPVCQHGNLAHRVVDAANQFVNLGLRLGRGVKAAVVLVYAVEPERLVAPRVGRREHQLRRHIVEVDHVGLAVASSTVNESICRPSAKRTEGEQVP